jgi:hypothetical protein
MTLSPIAGVEAVISPAPHQFSETAEAGKWPTRLSPGLEGGGVTGDRLTLLPPTAPPLRCRPGRPRVKARPSRAPRQPGSRACAPRRSSGCWEPQIGPDDESLQIRGVTVQVLPPIPNKCSIVKVPGNRAAVVGATAWLRWPPERVPRRSREAVQGGLSGARLTALPFRNVALVFVNQSFVVGGCITEVSPAADGLPLTVVLPQRSTGLTNVGCGDVHLVSVATGSTRSGHRS